MLATTTGARCLGRRDEAMFGIVRRKTGTTMMAQLATHHRTRCRLRCDLQLRDVRSST